MRVVITGGTGNVGTSLISTLAEEPAVSSIAGLARRMPEWSPAKTEWIRADVVDDDLVGIFRGADAVVHLAWELQPAHDLERIHRTNVVGSTRVFDAVAEAGVPVLLYASSIGAYSPGPKDRRVDESWPTHGIPSSMYSRQKAYVERVLDALEARVPHLRVVRLRPALLFKRESASEQLRLFGGILAPRLPLRPRMAVLVPRIPGLRFQALHTDDCAEAYKRVLLQDVRGAFNVAADPVLDIETIGRILDARTIPIPPPAVRGAAAAGFHLRLQATEPGWVDLAVRSPVMSTERAEAELGWKPTRTSTDTLRELFAGIRDDAGMPTPPLRPPDG